MPDITNDVKPPTDYVDYFTKQLPQDLARMASLRDELEKRQGAMTSVEDSLRDRKAAADELAQAKADAAVILQDANAQAREVTADRAALAAAKNKFAAESKTHADSLAKRELLVESRETRLAVAEKVLAEGQAALEKAQAKLASDTAILEARVKAFQEKVAHLTA